MRTAVPRLLSRLARASCTQGRRGRRPPSWGEPLHRSQEGANLPGRRGLAVNPEKTAPRAPGPGHPAGSAPFLPQPTCAETLGPFASVHMGLTTGVHVPMQPAHPAFHEAGGRCGPNTVGARKVRSAGTAGWLAGSGPGQGDLSLSPGHPSPHRQAPLQHQGFLSRGQQTGRAQWLCSGLRWGVGVSFEERIPMTSQRTLQGTERGWAGGQRARTPVGDDERGRQPVSILASDSR